MSQGYLTDRVQANQIVTTTAGAAAQTAITSTAVDMAGYDGVRFTVLVGTLVSGAVTSMKLQQSDDDAASDAYSDLLGTNQAIADTESNKTFVVDVQRPQKRYLKLVITRGTQNATIGGVIADKYQKRFLTTSAQGTAVTAVEQFNSPAEGTA